MDHNPPVSMPFFRRFDGAILRGDRGYKETQFGITSGADLSLSDSKGERVIQLKFQMWWPGHLPVAPLTDYGFLGEVAPNTLQAILSTDISFQGARSIHIRALGPEPSRAPNSPLGRDPSPLNPVLTQNIIDKDGSAAHGLKEFPDAALTDVWAGPVFRATDTVSGLAAWLEFYFGTGMGKVFKDAVGEALEQGRDLNSCIRQTMGPRFSAMCLRIKHRWMIKLLGALIQDYTDLQVKIEKARAGANLTKYPSTIVLGKQNRIQNYVAKWNEYRSHHTSFTSERSARFKQISTIKTYILDILTGLRTDYSMGYKAGTSCHVCQRPLPEALYSCSPCMSRCVKAQLEYWQKECQHPYDSEAVHAYVHQINQTLEPKDRVDHVPPQGSKSALEGVSDFMGLREEPVSWEEIEEEDLDLLDEHGRHDGDDLLDPSDEPVADDGAGQPADGEESNIDDVAVEDDSQFDPTDDDIELRDATYDKFQ